MIRRSFHSLCAYHKICAFLPYRNNVTLFSNHLINECFL